MTTSDVEKATIEFAGLVEPRDGNPSQAIHKSVMQAIQRNEGSSSNIYKIVER